MLVDYQTLCDLDIVPGAEPSGTLIDWLDRTSTRGGRKVLARRLTSPLGSIEEIQDVQAALGFLEGGEGARLQLPGDPELAALGRYVGSNRETLKRHRVPGIWWEAAVMRIRYPEHYQSAVTGSGLVRSFIARMQVIGGRLRTGPPLLSRMGDRVLALLSTPALQPGAPPAGGGSAWLQLQVLRADRMVREEGRVAIENLVSVVHELDALTSMARVGAELGFVLPEFSQDSAGLRLEGLWHPFIEDPVQNDLVMGGDERIVFLTGPNMAGKTTYLKACGVAVLLAHCGMGIPARAASLRPVHRLITAVRTEDNLREGVSYFQAEARRVRGILNAVSDGDPCFVIADELFRGTNVKDAFDATTAVLNGLLKLDHSRFLVASHLVEVARELERRPGVLFRHFGASPSSHGEVEFTYRAEPGVSSQRLGMEVLRREGVLDALKALESSSGGAQ